MTTAQRTTIAHIEAAHEAQRFQAEQAGRPMLSERDQAVNLYHAMMAAKNAGDITKARELAIALKPLMSYLD